VIAADPAEHARERDAALCSELRRALTGAREVLLESTFLSDVCAENALMLMPLPPPMNAYKELRLIP
jgi:hypothetical protein